MHFRFKPRRNPGSQSQHRSVNRTAVTLEHAKKRPTYDRHTRNSAAAMAKAPLVHDRYTPDTGVVRPSTMAAGASIGAVRIRQISNSGRAEWMRYSSAVRRKLDWGAPAPPERHPASRRVAENRERLDPRQSRRYSRRASALADIAETQAAIDAPDAARKTIAEALAVVPKAGGGKERTSALSAIAKAQAATGDIAAARATGGRVHELVDRI